MVRWQKSTKVMCEEILQLYSSQYSSESLAIKILLSTTGLFSTILRLWHWQSGALTPLGQISSRIYILLVKVDIDESGAEVWNTSKCTHCRNGMISLQGCQGKNSIFLQYDIFIKLPFDSQEPLLLSGTTSKLQYRMKQFPPVPNYCIFIFF